MSRVPTSVAIVATMHDGEPVGMAVGTFTAVSLDPMLVGYLGENGSRTVSLLLAAEQVSCSLLHESQLEVVTAFKRPVESRFDGISWDVELSRLGDVGVIPAICTEQEGRRPALAHRTRRTAATLAGRPRLVSDQASAR